METSGSATVGMVTVKVAVASTTVASGFDAWAVMAVVPALSAVATPVAGSIVATVGLLELQTAAAMVAPPTVAD